MAANPRTDIPLRRHLRASRVTKRINPERPGTKRLLKQHGDALVCVRYRQDPLKLFRFTTVELVVAASLIDPRRFDRTAFGIHIGPGERQLRLAAIAAGARWHEDDGLWWLRGGAICRLGVVDRIRKR